MSTSRKLPLAAAHTHDLIEYRRRHRQVLEQLVTPVPHVGGLQPRVGGQRTLVVVVGLRQPIEAGSNADIRVNLHTLAVREAANGRLGYLGQSSPEAIAHYFSKSLIYKLGDREFAGIRRFHELCIKYGLVPNQPLPHIL